MSAEVQTLATTPALTLVLERKIADLIPPALARKRWEASGVLVKDGHYFVVFDDRTEIARLADDLAPSETNGLFGIAKDVKGFEGITYNHANERYYLLVESRKHTSGRYQALLVEYDRDFEYLKDRSIDFTFKSDNKGFEAVAHVRRDDKDFLLALCEGNQCQCGKKGRTPGGGRIQLFEKRRKRWRHTDTIALPETVPFVDYSGMSISNGRVAIVSQENSLLWVGEFDDSQWTWRDSDQLYEFPRFDDGSIQYGNIEGVGWLAPNQIVAVSDRRKKNSQPDERLSNKDQSVHIFEIPSASLGGR